MTALSQAGQAQASGGKENNPLRQGLGLSLLLGIIESWPPPGGGGQVCGALGLGLSPLWVGTQPSWAVPGQLAAPPGPKAAQVATLVSLHWPPRPGSAC